VFRRKNIFQNTLDFGSGPITWHAPLEDGASWVVWKKGEKEKNIMIPRLGRGCCFSGGS
jgi:hypothetical protein